MTRRKVAAELRDAARQVRAQGWSIETGGSHQKWTSPDGAIVTVPSTPSDSRTVANVIAELRRNGAVINGRAGSVRAEPVCRRQGDSLPQIGQRAPQQRSRHRERPWAQKRYAPGFEFPDFDMPSASWSTDSAVEEAQVRAWAEKAASWLNRRVCDCCCRQTGADTLIVLLEGSEDNCRQWFLRQLPLLSPTELEKLMARPPVGEYCARTAQLCTPCAVKCGISEARTVPYTTYGDVIEAWEKRQRGVTDWEKPLLVATVDVDSHIPPAFLRKGLPPGTMSRGPFIRGIESEGTGESAERQD